MNVLSIDFDYFVEADNKQRIYFPDGGVELSQELNSIIWACLYASCPFDMLNVGVLTEELSKISGLIDRQNKPRCMVADSHRHAYGFIKKHRDVCSINVYNIDYHHDMYNDKDSRDLNCGNWLRLLIEEEVVDNVYWIKRDESDDDHINDNKACSIVPLDCVLVNEYDLVCISRSSWWVPPHLDSHFLQMLLKPLYKDEWDCVVERSVLETRYNKEFLESIAAQKEALHKTKEILLNKYGNQS